MRPLSGGRIQTAKTAISFIPQPHPLSNRCQVFSHIYIYIFKNQANITASALYSSRGISACKLGNLIHGYHIEVTFDAVLQAAGSNGKLNDLLRLHILQSAVNQPCAEGIPAAYTVNDVHQIIFAEIKIRSVIQHGSPFVVICGNGRP